MLPTELPPCVGAGAALTLGYMSEKLRQDALTPGFPDGKVRISDTEDSLSSKTSATARFD